MKKEFSLPLASVLGGAAALVLRLLQLHTGFEAGTGLAIPGNPAGIALVVKVGSGLCADAGESALASVVETAGTVCALAASLPLLRKVLELLMELMA